MKIKEAKDIINKKSTGFMVHFDWRGDGFLKSDHFPDKHAGEELIPTETEAWLLAIKFSKAMKCEICNVYVVDAVFSPVDDHIKKLIGFGCR